MGKFALKTKAVAGLLRPLANDKRLLILANLSDDAEVSVGQLADKVGLSQSALSQHLSALRKEGLLDSRRQARTVFYHLTPDVRGIYLLPFLRAVFQF
jgi:ArsR family transcriptional regulator